MRQSTMQRKNIIYILCLGHSGSTLLEYYFSTYPGKIGIGEAYKAVRSFRKDGLKSISAYDRETINSTPFWKHVLSTTDQYDSLNSQYISIYKHLNESEEFSQYDTIIDSSKTMDALRILHKEFGDNVKVAVVIKDVRSWIISQYENNRRKNRKIPFAYNFRLITKWYRKNLKIQQDLDAMKINYTMVPYDLFCLNRQSVENTLKEQFSLDGDANFSKTNSINILGNRMKKEANLELKISYDYRWMQRNEWNLPWLFLPPKLKKFNFKHVWQVPSK
jgi:hypothetical protein